MNPEPYIVSTADGSKTLFSKRFNEHYHSTHGARQESLHVFIKMGLASLSPSLFPIKILEVGGGTLLNARLTEDWLIHHQHNACYHIAEAYPPNLDTLKEFWEDAPLPFDWYGFYSHKKTIQSEALTLEYQYGKLEEAILPKSFYNLVYFDAFAPSKQPELWTNSIFAKIADSMLPGGSLVTYCAQGQFKRNLKQVGFSIENLPGPLGKREMTRAIKA
ncbi:MAG: tRNA (5-methylaminomethyl-2-thiouridine)(34)-methyltransferase MnmD [Bacteroidetes bacterium]|nr:tRNA (5-methylaminomethyl-2-thiouridine)(34)-methyltransferase MnmD [Bacteroidota bacterium]